MRKHLGSLLKTFGLEQGKNHWSDEKLFNQSKRFLQMIDPVKFSEVDDEEVWITVVLIYPNRGTKVTSEGKTRVSKEVC
jgi:hypothetical protein